MQGCGRSSECGFRWNELRMAFWMSFGKFKFRLSLEVEYAVSEVWVDFRLSLEVEYAGRFPLSLECVVSILKKRKMNLALNVVELLDDAL
uniref:Uncharacterized protein n=1 Tax=Rhizophagus irregularis (strain DAOM 181602 / DAOM 197198 / MUCL 43194) TaxID=747089 RepID=U9TW56_RHIID